MTTPLRIAPDDRHNRTLVANVHPPDWRNPTPSGRYNLVVIGAGTAGLITSLVAASLGARVALVERHLMGGDCLNVGCVPSKSVIRAARMVHGAREARALGLRVGDDLPDFAAAMERMRAIRARISHEDSAHRYSREFGVDIYLGSARFAGDGRIQVGAEGDGTGGGNARGLAYRKAVIATGARAVAPPVEGLAAAGYLDNESVFTLTERPKRLGVIGAGPIGCELAQSFRRLGSQVTLFDMSPQILSREDADAAVIVQEVFVREGITLELGCQLERVVRKGDEKVVHFRRADGTVDQVVVDEILVGAGRAPNVEDLGLESVGVEFDPKQGVYVDDRLRTTNKRIYAAGDACMAWKFTHAAEAAAKIVVQNALFFGRRKLSSLVMPWCTYTDPELAHVGLHPHEARERRIEIATYEVPIARANRAVTDGEEQGLVKVHVKKGSDRIVGATVVASHAGEMLTLLTLAIQRRIGLGAFTHVIFPYPTQSEAIKAVSGLYTRTRLTPGVERIFRGWLSLTR
jgi:pyruvate/2-oxoglutarate dehydrogenase complex dihydrolipoamide dehydrogenase (E3) component